MQGMSLWAPFLVGEIWCYFPTRVNITVSLSKLPCFLFCLNNECYLFIFIIDESCIYIVLICVMFNFVFVDWPYFGPPTRPPFGAGEGEFESSGMQHSDDKPSENKIAHQENAQHVLVWSIAQKEQHGHHVMSSYGVSDNRTRDKWCIAATNKIFILEPGDRAKIDFS